MWDNKCSDDAEMRVHTLHRGLKFSAKMTAAGLQVECALVHIKSGLQILSWNRTAARHQVERPLAQKVVEIDAG